MTVEKIRVNRDKNSTTIAISESPSSLLTARIILRDTSNVHCAVLHWKQFEVTRSKIADGTYNQLNIFELSCAVSKDIGLT